MTPVIQTIATQHSPESLAQSVYHEQDSVLLRTSFFDQVDARYSFVTCAPFLTFRSFGSKCEVRAGGQSEYQFGNPWHLLDRLMERYELLDEPDFAFPLGGAFGFWGYDLKNFVEPKLSRCAVDDLDLPDCHVGFYDSLVVFDHHLGCCSIISTGLLRDGSRSEARAAERHCFWRTLLEQDPTNLILEGIGSDRPSIVSNIGRDAFLKSVRKTQDYIRAGDIYQVNLSHRISTAGVTGGWDLFNRLQSVSPSPFGAYLHCGEFEIASSSPESFLRMSGSHIRTRPIKGTRPRSSDPLRDSQFTYELQTSSKEISELVMITDLLRNDLGHVCSYGSVIVPELLKLERYPQVQHLVSTVEGNLRTDVTHFEAFSTCFPGGSVTGAPKFRAMEIIDELEPIRRGPYTGALGYIGFNRESQLSIIIRTAICKNGSAHFHVGAGIVAESVPRSRIRRNSGKSGWFSRRAKLFMLGQSKRTAMIVFLDGQFVPEAEAVVSVFDRCFLYGDGLFEAVRLYEGKTFRWTQHFDRLKAGARLLDIRIPLAEKRLYAAATELWRRNDSPLDAMIRLTLSRGVGSRGYSPAGANNPRIIMTLHPLPAQNKGKSFKLITASVVVPAGDRLSRYKTCNKLHQIVARMEADRTKAQEAILINSRGCIAEASSSNLFWIADGVICTPPLSDGGLAGITRSIVFEIALSLGLPAAELETTPKGLLKADGIFLSFSGRGLVEVTEFNARRVLRSPLVEELKRAYHALVLKELS